VSGPLRGDRAEILVERAGARQAPVPAPREARNGLGDRPPSIVLRLDGWLVRCVSRRRSESGPHVNSAHATDCVIASISTTVENSASVETRDSVSASSSEPQVSSLRLIGPAPSTGRAKARSRATTRRSRSTGATGPSPDGRPACFQQGRRILVGTARLSPRTETMSNASSRRSGRSQIRDEDTFKGTCQLMR